MAYTVIKYHGRKRLKHKRAVSGRPCANVNAKKIRWPRNEMVQRLTENRPTGDFSSGAKKKRVKK